MKASQFTNQQFALRSLLLLALVVALGMRLVQRVIVFQRLSWETTNGSIAHEALDLRNKLGYIEPIKLPANYTIRVPTKQEHEYKVRLLVGDAFGKMFLHIGAEPPAKYAIPPIADGIWKSTRSVEIRSVGEFVVTLRFEKKNDSWYLNVEGPGVAEQLTIDQADFLESPQQWIYHQAAPAEVVAMFESSTFPVWELQAFFKGELDQGRGNRVQGVKIWMDTKP